MADLRHTLFTALTGRTGDVSGKAGGDIREMLMAVGGPSAKTRSGIDLTRAAGKLGVSRRTVERWVKTADTGTGQRPSPAHLKALTGAARRTASTQRGRRAVLTETGMRQQLGANGARVSITGPQGPHAAGRDYMRVRTTQLDLDPTDVHAMLDAWEKGGDKGFLAWATGHWGEQYLDDWKFDGIDGLDIDRL